MKKIVQFIMLLLVWSNISSAQETYTNPIALTYDTFGIGDPSVFKWMGNFYLLASSGSGSQKGLQMWQSEDLVNWTHTGVIIDSNIGGDFWAPEMIYYEGTFYLYTSAPDGGNFNIRAFKYELPLDGRAKTPLGAFSLFSNDFIPGEVFDIDPSPFRDDNGDLYMFWSSRNEGINYKKLASPEDGVSNSVVQLGDCKTNITTEWTEGPTVHKIDGKYYMTYCGNDVLDPRYTISKARGNTLANLRETSNVFIQHTTGNWNGVGHNHWVLGPDLKTYYTTYHAKRGEGKVTGEVLHRRLMLDKIWVDGSGVLQTTAPSFNEQPIPALTDWSDDFNRTSIGGNWSGPSNGTSSLKDNFLLTQNSRGNGSTGKWWSKTISSETTSNDFVVEFNLKLNSVPVEGDSDYAVNTWPKFGVFVSQETEGANEENKIIYVALNSKTGNIETLISYNNNAIWEGDGVTLNGSDLTKWHTIRVQKKGLNLKVYYDNMLKIEKTLTSDIGGGHFGFITENSDADFGWVGFSNIN